MDYAEKLQQVDQLTFNGHHAQSVIAAASVLEELLRQLYQQVQPRLAPADQQTIAEKMSKLGHGKPISELTLGQIVGLYREAQLFDKIEKYLDRKLPRLRAADFNNFVELRNRAAHQAAEVHEDDARWAASQLHVWVREAGLLEEKTPPAQRGMTGEALRPWTRCVRLNSDVESGNTAIATYAIDLGAVIAGDTQVPRVYSEAGPFFQATYPTSSMRRLMEEVLSRLAGSTGDRVLQLRSPFGGGKSHLLLALYHAVRNRPALLAYWPESSSLADPGNVRVAWFDGEKFDVTGKEVAAGIRVRTLWGWLAWQLGGASLYQEVAYHDERRIAPGGDVIAKLISRGEIAGVPKLLLLDEILKYFERAQADTDVVGNSTLGRQTLEFIESLSTEVANSANAVMIYSLQASARESFGDVALLEMLDHLTARVDAKREPIKGDEILPVLQCRLLAEITDKGMAEQVAAAYAGVVTTMRKAHASDPASRRAAEDEGLALHKRFSAAYPFHPALIDIMSQRWASLPDFQRTRGALRFLATCLHALKREDEAATLLGPAQVPLHDAEVQNALFTEVGQRDPFKAVLLSDFTGPSARARRIDERLAREYPHLSGVHPARRLATAILMYSFGGATRAGESEGEVIGVGVTEPELLAAVVSPDLDSLTAQATLKELREQCLYLHFDGSRYVFKTTPNVTQLLEDEAENNVHAPEVRTALKENLQGRLAGRLGALVWPEKSADIPDKEARFLLAYLPLEFAQQGDAQQRETAIEYFTRCGSDLRKYRNGLGLAVPDVNQIQTLYRAGRYLKAIELLRSKRKQLNITQEQLEQLKERESTEKSVLESAMRNLYTTILLPQMANGALNVEELEIGGRPLGATGIHARLMELLTVVVRRVYSSVTPGKLVELMRLGESAGEGQPAPLGIGVEQVRDSFYSVIGFPRLEDENVLRRALSAGVKEGVFGYVGRGDRIERDRMGEGSGYFVGRNQAIIGRDLRDDEIDLSAGFIVLPAGIEAEAPATVSVQPGTPPAPMPTASGPAVATPPTVRGPGATTPANRVRLKLTLNRQQVYASFNAFANLADQAGTIEVVVDAQSLKGFDPVWLRNAVLEPLEEAEVQIEKEA
jgi:Protein of unknown function (DUF499)